MLREWGSFSPATERLREDPHGSAGTQEEVTEGGGGAPQPSGAVQRAAGRAPRQRAPAHRSAAAGSSRRAARPAAPGGPGSSGPLGPCREDGFISAHPEQPGLPTPPPGSTGGEMRAPRRASAGLCKKQMWGEGGSCALKSGRSGWG